MDKIENIIDQTKSLSHTELLHLTRTLLLNVHDRFESNAEKLAELGYTYQVRNQYVQRDTLQTILSNHFNFHNLNLGYRFMDIAKEFERLISDQK